MYRNAIDNCCLTLHPAALLNSFFFFIVPINLWDLSYLTRGQIKPPAVEAWSPNHWTTREFPLNSNSC